MFDDKDIDIRDIINDLSPTDNDKYSRDQVKDHNSVIAKSQVLEVPDSVAGDEDPTSEFLNLQDVTSLDEFPKSDTVPAVYISHEKRKTITKTRSYKPRASKAWTQRRSYDLFMGCLTWLRAKPENIFQQSYWAEQGIVERQIKKLKCRYPICQYVFEQIRAVQEAKLLEGAATERLHPGFVKFFLNCRYQDHYVPHTELKQEVTGQINNQQVQVVFEEVKSHDTDKSEPKTTRLLGE